MATIAEKWRDELLKKKQHPSHSNRASNMGHRCIRYLFFERNNHKERAPFSLETLARMQEGTEQEAVVKAYLQSTAMGFRIIRDQEEFGFGTDLDRQPFTSLQMSGHIDGFITNHDDYKDPILIEIKTVGRWEFGRLNTWEDFKWNHWREGNLDQATCYMKAMNVDKIIFIVKNREIWLPKEIPYHFEEDRWQDLELKCGTVNGYFDRKIVPAECDCDYSECDNCPYETFCCPDRVIIHEGYMRVTDEEQIAQVARYMQLKKEKKELETEYKELDQIIKQNYNGVEGAFIGDQFEITSKLVKRKGFTVDATEYWQTKVREL